MAQQSHLAAGGNPQDALELDAMYFTDLFNRITESCHSKCISPTYHEGELAKAESVCIDRCVAKFQLVHEIIGKKMQEMNQQGGMPGSPGG